MKKIILLLIIAAALTGIPCMQGLYSLDLQPSGEELGFYFTPEYNRALNFCWALSTTGSVTFAEMYHAKVGLSLGGAGNAFDMRIFAGGKVDLPIPVPLSLGLSYNYNGLPKYENHVHSLLPLVSLDYPRFGVAVGPNLRFTRFFGESPVFESMISASAYINFFYVEELKVGLEVTNFDDFTYGNFGSYYLKFYSVIPLNEKLLLVNDIEIHQGGSVALTSNFYGIVYRGGVKLSW